MDLSQLCIKLMIAVACSAVASYLLPRKIPGHLFGLAVIGLLGVLVGEWGYALLKQSFALNSPVFHWELSGVLIIPAIAGSLIVLFLFTSFLDWARLSR